VLTERLFGRIRGRTSGKFFLNAPMPPVMVWGWMRWQPWIWWRSNCGLSWHGCCRSRSWIFGIRYNRSTKPLLKYVARVLCAVETHSEIASSPCKGHNDDIILESNNIRPTFDSPSFIVGVFAR
jgi:hypothetical protein